MLTSADIQTTVFTSISAIQRFGPALRQLQARLGSQADPAANLDYFLTKNHAEDRRPILALVHEGEALVLAMFLYEQMVLGVPAGLVRGGNDLGEGVVLGPVRDRHRFVGAGLAEVARQTGPQVLYVAVNGLSQDGLAGVWNSEALRSVRSDHRLRLTKRPMHRKLLLRSTFEETLQQFGKHTRRNLRYYRRKLDESVGAVLINSISPADSVEAIQEIVPHSRFSKSASDNLRYAKVSELAGGFAMGLKAADGKWLSYITGWRTGKQTFVEWQVNHSGFERESLCTVMRSFLLEHECELGQEQIIFVGGSSEVLQRYCEPESCTDVLLTRRGIAANLLERVIAPCFLKHTAFYIALHGTEVNQDSRLMDAA